LNSLVTVLQRSLTGHKRDECPEYAENLHEHKKWAVLQVAQLPSEACHGSCCRETVTINTDDDAHVLYCSLL
jgi:hypothetical protein